MALVTSAMVNEMSISMGDLKRMKILPASFPSVLVNKTCIDLAALKEAIVHDYPNVFRDKLREEPMAGEPMVIHLKEGAVPTRPHSKINTSPLATASCRSSSEATGQQHPPEGR